MSIWAKIKSFFVRSNNVPQRYVVTASYPGKFGDKDPIQLNGLGLGTNPVLDARMVAAGQYASIRATATVDIDWSNGNCQVVNLASGVNTITMTNPIAGGRYLLELKQPSAGASGTVIWPANVKWVLGVTPTLTVTLTRTDCATFYYNGTNYASAMSYNYDI